MKYPTPNGEITGPYFHVFATLRSAKVLCLSKKRTAEEYFNYRKPPFIYNHVGTYMLIHCVVFFLAIVDSRPTDGGNITLDTEASEWFSFHFNCKVLSLYIAKGY